MSSITVDRASASSFALPEPLEIGQNPCERMPKNGYGHHFANSYKNPIKIGFYPTKFPLRINESLLKSGAPPIFPTTIVADKPAICRLHCQKSKPKAGYPREPA
jgi:hypothetical protein